MILTLVCTRSILKGVNIAKVTADPIRADGNKN